MSKYWEIDEIRPAYHPCQRPSSIPTSPFEFPPHDRDEKGRMKMPAYLLTAHKAGR